jgi:hypothetical protein
MRERLLAELGSPNYRARLITNWQSTQDIVRAIQQQHKANRAECKAICSYFDKGSQKETARAIFNFLKSEIQYDREPTSRQTTKTIKRFLSDGKGDCKHYSLFINGILEACGYTNAVYRFAGYSRQGYTHVYSYLPQTDTVVDAVLSAFDTEKKPIIKKDMSLYSLSGVTPDSPEEISGVNFTKITQNLKKASAKASNVVQKAVKELPKATAKLADTSKTVSLAPARAAFLTLVSLNGLGLASNLKALVAAKGKASLDFWDKLGGEPDKLLKAIDTGAAKKALLAGVEEEMDSRAEIFDGYSGDGVGAVGIAATVASATPILLKVKDILGKAGIKPADVKKLADTTKKGAENFQKLTGKKVTDVIFKKDKGQESPSKTSYTANDLSSTSKADAEKVVKSSIALATGTDMATIEEIKNTTSLIAPVDTTISPDAPSPSGSKPRTTDIPISLPTLDKKLLLLAGAGVFVYFVLRKK